jgi:GNAT superfamily N-acetyltransferase
MMELSIRLGREDDATALATLLRELDKFPRIQDQEASETLRTVETQVRLALADGSHGIFVAEEKGGPMVAYLMIHWLPYLILSAPEGFISELFVHPRARGFGAGHKLLEAAAQEAKTRGCARLGLINFRTDESYQRYFYAKNGWTERPDAANFIFPLPV